LNIGEHCHQVSPKLLWDKANIDGYRADVYEHLSRVQLPVKALLCNECCDETHHVDIENYYNSLISCLRSAASDSVPPSKFSFHKHWWTPELEDLKQKCIDVTDIWKSAGKPCSGDINAARLRCKYLYKHAIKEAAELASTEINNDDLYNHLCNKDTASFWKAWRKRYCFHCIKPTGTLNGHVGDDNIHQVFTDHFKSLYEPNAPCADSDFQKTTEELLQYNSVGSISFIDIATINVCIGSLKYRKMHGRDGISNEYIIHSPPVLSVHLSVLFNSFLRHGFVPSDYCFGVILPLLKNKHGDASKLDKLTCTVALLYHALSRNCLKCFIVWLTVG